MTSPIVAGSRTWQRTVSNLFVPHNAHVVPAWRILTWALVACSGNLERLPTVLAIASYSILVAVMLMTGRLVARETGRTSPWDGVDGAGWDDLAHGYTGHVVFGRPTALGGLGNPG